VATGNGVKSVIMRTQGMERGKWDEILVVVVGKNSNKKSRAAKAKTHTHTSLPGAGSSSLPNNTKIDMGGPWKTWSLLFVQCGKKKCDCFWSAGVFDHKLTVASGWEHVHWVGHFRLEWRPSVSLACRAGETMGQKSSTTTPKKLKIKISTYSTKFIEAALGSQET